MKALRALMVREIKSRRVTVLELERATGIQRSLLYRYMRGEQTMCTVETLERILEALGKHAVDVFGEPKK